VRQDGRALALAADARLAADPELQPARARSNAIAGCGARAPVAAITRVAPCQEGGIEVAAALGLGGERVWCEVLAQSATLGDLARRLAALHGGGRVIHLSLPGGLGRASPLDAPRLLVDLL